MVTRIDNFAEKRDSFDRHDEAFPPRDKVRLAEETDGDPERQL
jgi:hypothetical protein